MTSSGFGNSSSDVAQQAEDVRAGLVETLDQLRNNLRPENMVHEVVANARIGADTLTDGAYKLARENPIPALLIGSACALIMGFGARASTKTVVDHAPRRGLAYRDPGAPTFESGATDLSPSRSLGKSSRLAEPKTSRSMGLASVTMRDSMGRETMNNTVKNTLRSPRHVTSRLRGLLNEQPFILAALGVAVGAAIGAAIPTTDVEDEWMGGASASLRHAAQDLARDEVDGLKDTAVQTADSLRQSVRAHGFSTDNLNDMVRDAGEHAKAAIHDVGQSIDSKA